MFCKNCGKFIEAGTDFCTGCGQKVNGMQNETQYVQPVIEAKPQKSKAPVIIAAIFVIVILIIVFSSGGDNYVDMVKGGYLSDYPNMPIGAAFDSFFDNPEWKSFQAGDGSTIVEFNGTCTYWNEDTNCTFQFEVREDSGEFEITYAGFGTNDSMSILEMYALLESVEDNYIN